MRVTVGMIVEALAALRTIEQLLFDFPYLEEEDIREAPAFAARLAQGHEIPGELIAKETSPKAPPYRSTGRVGHAPEYCRLHRSPETLFCPPTARIVGDPEVIHFDGLSANRTGGSVHQQALRQRGLTAKSCLVG